MILLLISALALFSPVIAIVLSAAFYTVHRRHHEPAESFPLVAYVLILLAAAVVAFWLGMVQGVAWACSEPASGNLCGLFGVFISGPLVASLAVIVLGWALLGFPRVTRGYKRERVVPSPVCTQAATAGWYRRLWRGEYSLAQSFWLFLILGTIIGTLIRANPLFLFVTAGGFLLQPVLLGYDIAASVGVWRSGDRLAAAAARPGSLIIISAKVVAVLLVIWQGLILMRMLRFVIR